MKNDILSTATYSYLTSICKTWSTPRPYSLEPRMAELPPDANHPPAPETLPAFPDSAMYFLFSLASLYSSTDWRTSSQTSPL